MQDKKQLRKPQNWQGFEHLCKKLWGEIWNCPEIKKNGRPGQSQNGVDVYGIPHGEDVYYGIQCKCKSDDVNAELTTEEIDKEIENAKGFKPLLKKLYFATTANKDVRIEEYIRTKDVSNRAQRLFGIFLYSWDDIVDLIDENKGTHDWYVNSINFKQQRAVVISFGNGSSDLSYKVQRTKDVKNYCHRPSPFSEVPAKLTNILTPNFLRAYEQISRLNRIHSHTTQINKSYINFSIKLANTGSVVLTNYKLIIEVAGISELLLGEVLEFDFPIMPRLPFSLKRTEHDFLLQILPNSDILVPGDEVVFKSFSVRPTCERGHVEIKWQLLSSDFKEEGILSINYDTIFWRNWEDIIISPDQNERKEVTYTDFFEEKKGNDNYLYGV